MQTPLTLSIGGLVLRIDSDRPLLLRKLPEEYDQFIRQDMTGSPPDLEIFLDMDTRPDTAGLERIFTASDSWYMYSGLGPARRCLVFSPPIAEGRPLWAAYFEEGIRKIAIRLDSTKIGEEGGMPFVTAPLFYPVDQMLFMYILSVNDGVLLHAAGCVHNEQGYLFAGRSGAGKSTIARLLGQSGRILRLSDDRIAVRNVDGKMRAFGTPWPGTEGVSSAADAPLRAIFFLAHGSSNELRPLAPAETINRLLPVASVPWYDRAALQRVLAVCEKVVREVPSYEFAFRPDENIVAFLADHFYFDSSKRG